MARYARANEEGSDLTNSLVTGSVRGEKLSDARPRVRSRAGVVSLVYFHDLPGTGFDEDGLVVHDHVLILDIRNVLEGVKLDSFGQG